MQTASYTRLDLLNSDGTRNQAAFAWLLARRIEQETTLRLCAAIGIHAPRDISLGDVPGWRREQVALRGLTMTEAERNIVERTEREELEAWVKVMQRAADKQRNAMDEAYRIAAE